MSDAIITALITGTVTVTVNLLSNWSARKKDAINNAVRDQKIEDSIIELTKRVDDHNGMMDKVSEMSADMKSMRTDLDWLKKEHQK